MTSSTGGEHIVKFLAQVYRDTGLPPDVAVPAAFIEGIAVALRHKEWAEAFWGSLPGDAQRAPGVAAESIVDAFPLRPKP